MNETNDCLSQLPQKKNINHYLRKWYYGFLYWMYLYIWCRYCYRHVMKLMHKFNLHHTTVLMPSTVVMPYEKENVDFSQIGDKVLKKKHLWCQWCGLRGDVLEYDNK